MAKWGDVNPVSKWDMTHAECVGCNLHVTKFRTTETEYGLAYVATCEITNLSSGNTSQGNVLLGGSEMTDDIAYFIEEAGGARQAVPVDFVVMQGKSKKGRMFYKLIDPDQLDDFIEQQQK